jgi:hypothetical protein
VEAPAPKADAPRAEAPREERPAAKPARQPKPSKDEDDDWNGPVPGFLSFSAL